MGKSFLCLVSQIFVSISLLFNLGFASQELKKFNADLFCSEQTSSEEQLIHHKVYIDPTMVKMTSTGIFLNINEVLVPISFIAVDDHGFFTSPSYRYEPWHDDDWLCPRCNNWNPSYEGHCVYLYCGKPKPPNPKRWKDIR